MIKTVATAVSASSKPEAFGMNTQQIKLLRKEDPDRARKLIKKLKRKKAKQKTQEKPRTPVVARTTRIPEARKEVDGEDATFNEIEVEYVAPSIEETLEVSNVDEDQLEEMKGVLERFRAAEAAAQGLGEEEEGDGYYDEEDGDDEGTEGMGGRMGIDDEEEEEEEEEQPSVTKKKQRQMARPTVAKLKQISRRPDVVEVWDTTAPDPKTLVWLKGYRNTVPVPLHWSHKRNYLAGKKGIEKGPFKLPHYIEATKISEIRAALLEKEAQKSLKQRQREKARPKSHRMDIDYQTLHDAFFRYATKPPLTRFGDVYYEGKEYEQKMGRFKPGKLSQRLRDALSMTSELGPPPWLLNMQRYGPPPSYPSLRVPGVNAPIPHGAEYGFHPGGWGKLPVDQYGNPVFGDLGSEDDIFRMINIPESALHLWGELQEEDIQSEADEEMEDLTVGQDEEDRGATPAGIATPALESGVASAALSIERDGMQSMTGTTSVTSGLESSIDLRRKGYISATPTKAYTVLKETSAPSQPGALFTSSTAYRMPTPGTSTPASAGTSTPIVGGLVTPIIGGAVTPTSLAAGASSTGFAPVGGMATPLGVMTGGGTVVSLNPSEMEQEGVFAADVIRQQLSQHEEAAARARRAAGQVDPKLDVKKEEKKKKKKTFKF